MQELGWLTGVFGTVRCAGCGTLYGRGGIAVVGNRDDYWFVRCSCLSCGAQGLGVVIVKETVAVAAAAAPSATAFPAVPLGVDDVLEAHEILRRYAGNVHGLF